MDRQTRHRGAGTSPEIAVIVPFDDPRGEASHLTSWTREQTCAADRFEVIAITNGQSAELDAQLRRHLRPQDKLVHTAATNRFGYYDPGARASTAPLLLLTEDHCIADARCVDQALKFMDRRSELDGGFLAGGHINRSAVAETEQQVYEQLFAEYWSRDEHWDKVRIRGTVLTKEAYFAAGGLPNDHFHFAETLLSARLYCKGYRLGYVADALVHHINTFSLSMMQREILDFVVGECRYRDAESVESLEPFIGVPPTWSQRHLRSRAFSAGTGEAISLLIGRHKQRLDRAGLATLRRLRRSSRFDAMAWLRWRERKLQLSVALEQCRFFFARRNRTKRLASLLRFWTGVTELGRQRYCAAHTQLPRPLPLRAGEAFYIGESSAAAIMGFHANETWQSRSFRWAGAVAALLLDLPPAAGELCIDTAGLRGPSCDFPFVLLWNGREIPAEDIRILDGQIRCALPKASFAESGAQHLLIAAAPVPRNATGPVDPRTLGMPIHSICFTPSEAAPHAQERKRLAGPHWLTPASETHAAR